jgi:hypothetical protein
MVIESPSESDTSVNACLASIPFLSAVVLLNRPDSPIACVLVPSAVKVFDNTNLVVVAAVPFVHVLVVAVPLSNPTDVDVSFPNSTNVS